MPDALTVLAERPLHLMRSSTKREIVQPFNHVTTRMAVAVHPSYQVICHFRGVPRCPAASAGSSKIAWLFLNLDDTPRWYGAVFATRTSLGTVMVILIVSPTRFILPSAANAAAAAVRSRSDGASIFAQLAPSRRTVTTSNSLPSLLAVARAPPSACLGACPELAGASRLAAFCRILPRCSTLTGLPVRTILRATATSDRHTGVVPNADWGFEKLDVFEAVSAVEPLCPADIDHDGTVVPEDGIVASRDQGSHEA